MSTFKSLDGFEIEELELEIKHLKDLQRVADDDFEKLQLKNNNLLNLIQWQRKVSLNKNNEIKSLKSEITNLHELVDDMSEIITSLYQEAKEHTKKSQVPECWGITF